METRGRVTQGGIFSLPKVRYSPETEAFIKELIKESKLSIFQRKKVQEAVKNGEPLPQPPCKTAGGNRRKPREDDTPRIIHFPRRRTQSAIVQSGAYERDMFAPSYAKANHDEEKVRLQDIMSYGKCFTKNPKKPKKLRKPDLKAEDLDRKSIFIEVMNEIKERSDFLKEMEALGHGKKYKNMIQQEIAAKLRHLAQIDKDLYTENKDVLAEFEDSGETEAAPYWDED